MNNNDFTPTSLAQRWNVHRNSIYNAIREGTIPKVAYYRAGKAKLFIRWEWVLAHEGRLEPQDSSSSAA